MLWKMSSAKCLKITKQYLPLSSGPSLARIVSWAHGNILFFFIKIEQLSLKKMNLKMLYVNKLPFCFRRNVFIVIDWQRHFYVTKQSLLLLQYHRLFNNSTGTKETTIFHWYKNLVAITLHLFLSWSWIKYYIILPLLFGQLLLKT